MADNVQYTGNVDVSTIDITSIISDIANSNPNSAFVQDFFVNLANPLIEKVKNANVEGIKVDLGSLFGLNTEMTKSVSREFNNATKKLLQKVQTQIDDVKLGEINLNSLLGSTPEFSIWTTKTYQSTVRRYLKFLNFTLGKLEENKQTFNVTKNFGIANLIGATPQFSKLTQVLYELTVTKIFKQIRKQTNNLNFREFDIMSFLGATPEFSVWTRFKYQTTVRGLLKKISGFDINTLLKDKLPKITLPPPIPQKVNRPYLTEKENALMNQILAKKQPDQPKSTFVSDFEKKPEVIVSDFSEKALNEIKKIFPRTKASEDMLDKATKGEKKEGGFGDTIKRVLADMLEIEGALLVLGPILRGLTAGTTLLLKGLGIASLVSGLTDSGPTKGVKKLGGRILTEHAEKLNPFNWLKKMLPEGAKEWIQKKMPKTLGKTLGKDSEKILFKKIPIIGAIAGLGFGISRFLDGDIYGGLLEIASGVSSIFPGVGTGLSFAIDAILAVRDIKTGGTAEIGKSHPDFKKASNILWDYICARPPISRIIRMGSGLKKLVFPSTFMEGLKELSEIESGRSAFSSIPGIGFALDFLLSTPESDKEATEQQRTQNAVNFDLTKIIFDNLKDKWPFNNLIKSSKGIQKIIDGNVAEGLSMLDGELLGGALSPLLSIMDLKNNVISKVTSSASGFIDNIDKFLGFDTSKKSAALQPTTTGIDVNQHVMTSTNKMFDDISLSLDSVGDQFNTAIGSNNKHLLNLNKNVEKLLKEFQKTSKGIQGLGEKDSSNTQINTYQPAGQGQKGIPDTSVRDPAYDYRNTVWSKIR